MLKTIAFLLLAGFGWLGLSGKAEQMMLYHFDPTRILPAAAGVPAMTEIALQQNGETIILWVAKPAAGKPSILYFHGNAGNLANRARRFRAFTDRGFGVVAMAYPGSSGSSGTPDQDTILANAQTTLAAIRTYAGKSGVVLYGESLGTGVATLTAATRTAADIPVNALVLEAPYTSIPDVAAHLYPALSAFTGILTDTYPSIDRIGQTAIPLLILHGTDDQLIPVELGRQLFAAAPTPDKTFYPVRGAGHSNVWQPDAQKVLYDFLDRF
jgi:pimeloyl-ACP methyl ester carboxylesterase